MTAIRRLILVLLATLATLTTVGLASPAQAAQFYGDSGQAGSVTVYRVVGATNTQCPVQGCYQRLLQVPGPTVGRSPNGNTTQTLRVQYRTYRYNGASWVAYQTINRSYSMGTLGAIRLQQENFNNDGGYFTVQMSMSWHVTSTGLTLGTRSVNFNGNDYSCNAAVACTASSSGWVYLG